jgi:predicted enzyme related to lactoylglutathione lyase
MTLVVDWIAVDCEDPASLAEFWTAALGYEQLADDDPDEVLIIPRDASGPRFIFLKVPEGKSAKNRLHLDLRPEEQEAEVRRLTALGATEVDIGQGDVTWVVMADPEGNEFCVLRALNDDDRAEREALGIDREGSSRSWA